MKNALLMVVALVALMLVAAPSFAEDGKVSADGLAALGLGGLQEMTDAEGTQVRGRVSGTGMVIGTSVLSFQFVTPDTKNFINGSSINMVQGSAQFGLPTEILSKSHNVGFTDFTFAVANDPAQPSTPVFIGQITGSLGGFGNISLIPLP